MTVKRLTNVPAGLDPQLRLFLQQVRDGFTGMVTTDDFTRLRRQLSSEIEEAVSDGTPIDYSPPSSLSGLTVRSMFEAVALTWDSVFFGPGYQRGVGTIEIWRAPVNNLGLASIIQSVITDIAIDYIEPGQGYYYWVRAVSTGGTPGPYNSTAGTYGEAVIRPEDLLDALNGQITESELYGNLNNRIDKIDVTGGGGLVAEVSELGNITVQHDDSIAALQFDVTPLKAQWTIKTQVGDLVGGVGFYNNGFTTQFYVAADTFAVYSPGATTMSFVVDSGRVVMDGAFIKDATITDAQIYDLAVNKVTGITSTFLLSTIGTGNITDAYIGNTIQSTSYVSGSAGWRIIKSGVCEFRDIIARGDIEAQSLKANTVMVQTLNVAGEAVTAVRFGQGSSGDIPDESTVTVLTMASIALPTGMSGVVIDMSATVSTAGPNCNVFVEIYRNGAMIAERHAGAINDMSICVSGTFYDSSPGTSPVYSLKMRAGDNPGGGGGGTYYCGSPTLTITGAKR